MAVLSWSPSRFDELVGLCRVDVHRDRKTSIAYAELLILNVPRKWLGHVSDELRESNELRESDELGELSDVFVESARLASSVWNCRKHYTASLHRAKHCAWCSMFFCYCRQFRTYISTTKFWAIGLLYFGGDFRTRTSQAPKLVFQSSLAGIVLYYFWPLNWHVRDSLFRMAWRF